MIRVTKQTVNGNGSDTEQGDPRNSISRAACEQFGESKPREKQIQDMKRGEELGARRL